MEPKGELIMRVTEAIDNRADLIDVRDVIARVEELADEHDRLEEAASESDADREAFETWEDREEYNALQELLSALKGYGGDHQWEGEWYPVTLIRDSYFREYAEQFADDIGAINADATWPLCHIDWEAAAKDLQQDYSSVDFDGVDYWYR
jgi:hypothetical protein